MTPFRRSPAAPARPGRFVFAALLLTLVLAAMLGANALSTGRYHRSVAEGVLHDYAGFAATELEARVQAGLAQRLFPLLSVMEARGAANPGVPLISPSELGASVDSAVWRSLGDSITTFRLAPDGLLQARGSLLDNASRNRILDSLPRRARTVLSRTAYFATFWLLGPAKEGIAGSGKESLAVPAAVVVSIESTSAETLSLQPGEP